MQELEEKYPEYLSHIVLEVTEVSGSTKEHQQQKAEIDEKMEWKNCAG